MSRLGSTRLAPLVNHAILSLGSWVQAPCWVLSLLKIRKQTTHDVSVMEMRLQL